MKKIVVCLLSVFTAAVLFHSAFTPPELVQHSVNLAQAAETVKYTIEDIQNLQDFLLVRETPDLRDKDYDLNNDDRWDVFDLCLMKQQFLKNSSSENNVLIAYFTRAENVHLENPNEVDIDATPSASLLLPGNAAVMANHLDNIDDYDIIFLGYPNWGYTCPMAVFFFLEEYDFSGKTIIPFCTHGTGGLAGTVSDITEILPKDCTILQPIGISRSDISNCEDTIAEWISELGLYR